MEVTHGGYAWAPTWYTTAMAASSKMPSTGRMIATGSQGGFLLPGEGAATCSNGVRQGGSGEPEQDCI